METMILPVETLNLPEKFALKFKGKEVELVEKKDYVLILPVRDIIDEAYGMFASDGHDVERFLEYCRQEKEIELIKEDSLKPSNTVNVIEEMCGILKSDGKRVERFIQEQKRERDLEYKE
jgi:hypothetical protein